MYGSREAVGDKGELDRALGGIGVGLLGPQLLGTDPAASADLVLPVLAFSSETSRVGRTRAPGRRPERAPAAISGSIPGRHLPLLEYRIR